MLTLSNVGYSLSGSYLKLRFWSLISFPFGISRISSHVGSSSSGLSRTSLRRFMLRRASCMSRAKAMSSFTGLFSCPIMYCTESIIPSVISPFTTRLATSAVIRRFLLWFISTAPESWYWRRARLLIFTLNSFACIRSHSQRFCCSQALSFISCMPFTSCTTVLWLALCWAKRLWSSSARFFMNNQTYATYRALPHMKMRNIIPLYTSNTMPKMMILNTEKITLRLLPVRKSCMRLWSLMRCRMSPVILLSK